MSEHYFSAAPTSQHDLRRIRADCACLSLWFDTDAGVFSRDGLDPGTKALIEAVPPLKGRVLDLGCGWGPAGAFLKRLNPEIELVMSDVNPRAVELSRANLALNGVQAQVLLSDGFDAIHGTFDAIVTNPPIRTGKESIYGLFRQAFERLNEGGALYIVIRKQQGAPSALKTLRELDPQAEVIARKGGYWVIRTGKENDADTGGAYV